MTLILKTSDDRGQKKKALASLSSYFFFLAAFIAAFLRADFLAAFLATFFAMVFGY